MELHSQRGGGKAERIREKHGQGKAAVSGARAKRSTPVQRQSYEVKGVGIAVRGDAEEQLCMAEEKRSGERKCDGNADR